MNLTTKNITTTQINFQIPKYVNEKLKEIAKMKGETKSEFIRRSIISRINRINEGEDKWL